MPQAKSSFQHEKNSASDRFLFEMSERIRIWQDQDKMARAFRFCMVYSRPADCPVLFAWKCLLNQARKEGHMNKKFFAALASASMVLSAFGSAAVMADGFDTADAPQVETGDDATASDGSVAFTKANFPDADFRKAIQTALPDVKDNQAISKADLAKVTKLDVTTAQNIEGIQYFPNLTTFSSESAALTEANLSANKFLSDVKFTNASSLEELKMPATNTMKILYIDGTSALAPLPELDLSGEKALEKVTVINTHVGLLDMSGNSLLNTVDVHNNRLNTLKLDGALNLTTLNASNNRLYEFTVPANSALTALDVSSNKLLKLDVTAQPKLQSLSADNNMIESLDLTGNKNLTTLDVENNRLAALDLSKNASLSTPKLNGQHIYAEADNQTVSLADNKAFDPDNATQAVNGQFNGDAFTLKNGADAGSYQYNTKDAAGDLMPVAVVKANLMNRLYNPNSGEHFYTKDNHEKDELVKLDWKYEGIGWVAPEENEGTTQPVYRLYNPNAGDHHYTLNPEERDALVSFGWKAEGIGWYSPKDTTNFTTTQTGLGADVAIPAQALLREYNPNAKAAGAHNYTLNEAENDYLVSIGWIPEGTAWNALK